jgi:antitoxin PrlF
MAVLEIEAAVTERGQTTVPSAIRNMLRIGKRGTIVFRALDDGTVIITRKPDGTEDDPVLGRFLTLLETDMAAHPGRLHPVGAEFVEQLTALVDGVAVDLDEPLADDEG